MVRSYRSSLNTVSTVMGSSQYVVGDESLPYLIHLDSHTAHRAHIGQIEQGKPPSLHPTLPVECPQQTHCHHFLLCRVQQHGSTLYYLCYLRGISVCDLLVHYVHSSNLLSTQESQRVHLTCTSHQRYLLSVLVDKVYMS